MTAGLRASAYTDVMIRWIIVIFLALMLINWFSPLLQRMGFGKLPGDFRFKLFGRDWFIPLTTTILLSLVAGAISKFVMTHESLHRHRRHQGRSQPEQRRRARAAGAPQRTDSQDRHQRCAGPPGDAHGG